MPYIITIDHYKSPLLTPENTAFHRFPGSLRAVPSSQRPCERIQLLRQRMDGVPAPREKMKSLKAGKMCN